MAPAGDNYSDQSVHGRDNVAGHNGHVNVQENSGESLERILFNGMRLLGLILGLMLIGVFGLRVFYGGGSIQPAADPTPPAVQPSP